ncbi:glutamate-5-semialdehyde dehydrogenase [Inquilinus ginsengisoli]|uniref:Gamma-glutamyl phosphate reductase n=1 Tax=Inquilinus ginsengisoli TaxID=363840 RepID=A0ABU1JSX8_9PROT|nr:glutamate-5-semialdehyde dehydrogenase [Inquilinus ginsengisoli]MDR6291718.1 glutamate-5-semialdehyde dehydrogenase [Inquilinus ginsengisoli]
MTALFDAEIETTADLLRRLGAGARAAAAVLALAPRPQKDAALVAAAAAIRDDKALILAANAQDMALARQNGTSPAFLDRLVLDDKRIEAVAQGLEAVAALPDPIGSVLADWIQPNGMRIQRVRVPLGVVGVIFESRPNVTADAAALCLKSGNSCILRCGSDSFQTSTALAAAIGHGLKKAGLPRSAVQLIPTRDRAAVGELLGLTEFVDVIIPRGGKSLTARVAAESRIPVLWHEDGINHTYVHEAADPEMARRVVFNAKMRRTGVCGATETLLIDRSVAGTMLRPILDDLIEAGCEIRGDTAVQAIDPRVVAASDDDWDTEYLDAILSVKTVDGVDAAIEHVNLHGSHHTDCIVTADPAATEAFLGRVDSAIVLVNASTQFADGGEFGMGAEIGIATGRLHARGPVGTEQLTSYKYLVRGTGQTRP